MNYKSKNEDFNLSYGKQNAVVQAEEINRSLFYNKMNIQNNSELMLVEKKLICIKAFQLANSPVQYEGFDIQRLILINKYLLGNLYDFAGKIRNKKYEYSHCFERDNECLDSIAYNKLRKNIEEFFINIEYWEYLTDQEKIPMFSACLSDLYDIYPFYRGNSATIMLFFLDFAEKKLELNVDRKKFFLKYDLDQLMQCYEKDDMMIIKALWDCSIEKEKNRFFHCITDMIDKVDCIKIKY